MQSNEVLSLLRSNNNFVSGTDIATQLGISRTAVWKQIVKLRQNGYDIEAVPAKGYRLKAAPEYCKEEIASALHGLAYFSSNDLFFFPSLSSTNSVAAELATQTDRKAFIVVADHQTAGRGRLNRSWESPPGSNIYVSIVLRPELHPRDTTILTLLAGVAAASALRERAGVDVRLKWPNDLLIGPKKVGGILTEMRASAESVQFAIIGIGINVHYRTADMPLEIRSIATSLAEETNITLSRSKILAALIGMIDLWLKKLTQNGKITIIEQWRTLSATLGKTVSVKQGDTVIDGIAEDIDSEGFLLVRQLDGTLVSIYAGDVSHI